LHTPIEIDYKCLIPTLSGLIESVGNLVSIRWPRFSIPLALFDRAKKGRMSRDPLLE